jgi:hypothetical protein
MATEVENSNFYGVYLVGNVDLTGNVTINLVISRRRVQSMACLLINSITQNNRKNLRVSTEFMSSYLAHGIKGKANILDKNVTALLSPKVNS